MSRALLVVDVQNDFTEGGVLGVDGGGAVARGITALLRSSRDAYAMVVASRDWHDAANDNGGHFAVGADPDFVTTWPVHCVAGTPGADYHPDLDGSLVDVHVRKGMGRPAYSMFEGVTDGGSMVAAMLADAGVDSVDVVGIATDYCVRATALDALGALGSVGAGASGGAVGAGGASSAGGAPGVRVRVLTELVAGVAAASSAAALNELRAAGVEVVAGSDA